MIPCRFFPQHIVCASTAFIYRKLVAAKLIFTFFLAIEPCVQLVEWFEIRNCDFSFVFNQTMAMKVTATDKSRNSSLIACCSLYQFKQWPVMLPVHGASWGQRWMMIFRVLEFPQIAFQSGLFSPRIENACSYQIRICVRYSRSKYISFQKTMWKCMCDVCECVNYESIDTCTSTHCAETDSKLDKSLHISVNLRHWKPHSIQFEFASSVSVSIGKSFFGKVAVSADRSTCMCVGLDLYFERKKRKWENSTLRVTISYLLPSHCSWFQCDFIIFIPFIVMHCVKLVSYFCIGFINTIVIAILSVHFPPLIEIRPR